MAQEFPLLNGVAPSWADISVELQPLGASPVTTSDIAEITCSETIDFGVVRGVSGGRKMKRTTGQLDNEASIKLYRPGLQVFYRALMALAPTKLGQKVLSAVVFNIVIQHTPPGDVEIYTLEIRGCKLAGDSYSFAEGTDADQVEVPLNIMQIVRIIDGQEVVLL